MALVVDGAFSVAASGLHEGLLRLKGVQKLPECRVGT